MYLVNKYPTAIVKPIRKGNPVQRIVAIDSFVIV